MSRQIRQHILFCVPSLPVFLLTLLDAVVSSLTTSANHHFGLVHGHCFALIADAHGVCLVPKLLVYHLNYDCTLALRFKLGGLERTARLVPQRKIQFIRGEQIVAQDPLVL